MLFDTRLSALRLSSALMLFTASANGQAFEPRLLDSNTLLGGDAPRFVRRGGVSVGLGVPLAGGEGQAVIWTDAGTQILSTLPTHEVGDANAMDVGGMVVGTSVDVVPAGPLIKFFETAVVWPPGAPPVEVLSMVVSGPPLELLNTLDVLESGVLLGQGRDAALPALRGWILENGVLTDLGALPSSGNVFPRDMNEARRIVGEATDGLGRDHAFLWRNGVIQDLHVTSGVPGFVSEANAINESGTAVGGADFVVDGIQLEEAAMWLPDGKLVQLPNLGGQQSTCRDINRRGDVVGFSTTATNDLRAMLWRDGVGHDLNDLLPKNSGWTLLVANAISDDGYVVGEGVINGGIRAFILEPLCVSCTNYCASTPNSSGSAAKMSSAGWESIEAGFLTLVAEPVPADQFGLFFFGPNQTQVPFGNGVRCVAGGGQGLFRLPVVKSDSGGRLSHDLDFQAPPAATTLVQGTTWNFQGWFRDPAAGGASFDSSDGLTITFER